MTGNNWWEDLLGLPGSLAQCCTTTAPRQEPPSSIGLAGQCGVGLLLVDCDKPTYNNYNVRVQACLPGGAAEASRQIQPGDVLLRVDGRDVVGMRTGELGGMLLGPVGSALTLSMKRGPAWKGGEGKVYTVDLQRRWAAAGLKDLPAR